MADFKARPTVYKGTKMRSRLEAGFAAWLDEWNFDWEYEPCAFASERGQYLPDFRLENVWVYGSIVEHVYVEVKPTFFTAWSPERAQVVSQLKVIYESEPDAVAGAVCADDRGIFWKAPTPQEVALFSADDMPSLAIGFDWIDLSSLDDRRLGLGCALPASCGPWPDEYWKVRR